MATTEKNNVIVELYDLSITPRKDDRFGRVVTNKTLTEDDLIAIAVARRTDLNANTLKASMEILKEIGAEQLANGASVRFGLGYFNLVVNGVFIGDMAKWDSTQHSLTVNAVATADVRNRVNLATVDVRGMAASGLAINAVIDINSGKVNSVLTPGGGINITGSRIKIEGDKPTVGLSLINQTTNQVVPIPKTSILTNDRSKISAIVPAGLTAGDYKLSICTQYSNANTSLKEPRTFVFEYLLTVAG
ncbi:MAG TPA: DUF4469 domain-containing protein [Bacteroidales bacterium]